MTGPVRSAQLYTPEILSLAVSLSSHPFDPLMELTGEARSRTCGSVVAVSIEPGADGVIDRFGLNVRACAIGQAAAAIFAKNAAGLTSAQVAKSARGIEAWLAGQSARPVWPGLEMLEPAAAYPARHAAILLPWKAAQAALGKPGGAG